MRLSIRVGTAALLILAIFLIKRHIDTVQDDSRVPLSSFWRFGGSSAGSDSGNQGAPVDKTAMESDVISPQNYETTPIIVPNDRALVMAKLASEDTSWVANDLNEWVVSSRSWKRFSDRSDGGMWSTRLMIWALRGIPPSIRDAKAWPTSSTSLNTTTTSHRSSCSSTAIKTAGRLLGTPITWSTATSWRSATFKPTSFSKMATPISDARKHLAALKSSGPYGTLRAPDKRPRRPTRRPGKSCSTTPKFPKSLVRRAARNSPCHATRSWSVLSKNICSIIIGFWPTTCQTMSPRGWWSILGISFSGRIRCSKYMKIFVLVT